MLGGKPEEIRLYTEWLYVKKIIVPKITKSTMKSNLTLHIAVNKPECLIMQMRGYLQIVFLNIKLLHWILPLKISVTNCDIFICPVTELLKWKWHWVQLLAKWRLKKKLSITVFIKVIFFTVILKCERRRSKRKGTH